MQRHSFRGEGQRAADEIQCIYDPVPVRTYKKAEFENELSINIPDESIFEAIDYIIEKLGKDKYIAGVSGGFSLLTLLDGTENGLMLYALEPEIISAATTQRTKQWNQLDKYFIRKGVSGVLLEDDMAGSNGPLISPVMFRTLNLPHVKERIQNIKKFVPQIILHNCGNNIPVMDMLIEAGIDCYQSLQTTAGMEIGKLKSLFGKRLCFWGGVSVEQLIMGNRDDIRKEVRKAMIHGAPGGGFILGPSHSIAKNTKYENFMAMIDEFVKLRDKF